MPLHPTPTFADGLVIVDQPIRHSASSHVAHCVYAVSNADAAAAQSVADDVQAAWNSAFPPDMDSDSTAEPPRVLVGHGDDNPTVGVGAGSPLAGSAAASYPPPQVAVIVKKITSTFGRHGRGRFYIPWIASEAAIDEGGNINSGTVASIDTQSGIFFAALVSAHLPLILARATRAIDPVTGKSYVTAWEIGATVDHLQTEAVCATQRRRLARS